MAELHVLIPDEVAERLMKTAAARGISTESVAADALVPYVDACRPLSFAGTLHSGQDDLAERSEDILRTEPPR
jgi:hypothetical protein